jgi:hypothetical protein
MQTTTPAPAARGRGDDALALVEFALVFVLFFSMLFAIIAFGVLLSFQQTMTQSANEAARAAAVTTDTPGGSDEREIAAKEAVERFNSWGKECLPGAMNGTNGMDCSGISKHDCGGITDNPAVFPDCITVTLVYDYKRYPLLPPFPFIDGAIPNTVTATATAQISDVDPTSPTTVPPTSSTSTTLPDPCAVVPTVPTLPSLPTTRPSPTTSSIPCPSLPTTTTTAPTTTTLPSLPTTTTTIPIPTTRPTLPN